MGNSPTTHPLDLKRIQHVLDYYTHGQCPLTADDFLHISQATGLSVDVMLAQGVLESHLGTVGRRPLMTHNLYDVGNVDSGANSYMSSWIAGATRYATLVATKYGKTGEQLIARNFERIDGNGRYASDHAYVQKFTATLAHVRALMAEVQ